VTTDAADGRLRLRTPFDLHDGPPILPDIDKLNAVAAKLGIEHLLPPPD